ncbi:MAG: sorbosone dehydrogenase family protein, partial [Thermoanaerobaculia bacterium]
MPLAFGALILLASNWGSQDARRSTLNAEPSAAQPAATGDIVLQPLAGGLAAVTSIVSGGDGRLFLTEQSGRVRVWNGVSVQVGVFLDVSGLVSCCGELGLLSIAFHPQYASNGLFFVDYTNKAGNTVIARYQVSGNPD